MSKDQQVYNKKIRVQKKKKKMEQQINIVMKSQLIPGLILI